MKRIAGFLVLTSIVGGCDRGTSQEKGPETLPLKAEAAPKPSPQTELESPPKTGTSPSETAKVAAQMEPTSQVGAPSKPPPLKTKSAGSTKAGTASTSQTAPAQQRVSGAVVSGEGFRLQLHTQSPQVVGQPGTLTVTLNADAPYKCNEKYPYKFKFQPVDGVSFPNETVRGMNVKKDSATMSVPFSPQRAGNQSVSGNLSFSVCTDDKCLVEKQQLTVTFDVLDAT